MPDASCCWSSEGFAVEHRQDLDSASERRCSACVSHRKQGLIFRHCTIAKTYVLPGIGRHLLTRDNNASEVQRVRCGNGDDCAASRHCPVGSQRFYSHRQRKLFPYKATHESAAPDFATVFEPAQSDQHLSPAWQN